MSSTGVSARASMPSISMTVPSTASTRQRLSAIRFGRWSAVAGGIAVAGSVAGGAAFAFAMTCPANHRAIRCIVGLARPFFTGTRLIIVTPPFGTHRRARTRRLPGALWKADVREVRDLLIEIGEALHARGRPTRHRLLAANTAICRFRVSVAQSVGVHPPAHNHSAATTIDWQSKRRNQVSEFAPVSESVTTLFSKLMRNRPRGASMERSGNQVARSVRR